MLTKIATIANGQTVSSAVHIEDMVLVGIVTPSALTGTAFTFQASHDGVTYNPVHDKAGAAVSYTVAASRHTVISEADDFIACNFLKVVSGSAEGAERQIKLVLRSL